MALRSLIPAGRIAARFGALAPAAAADFRIGAGRVTIGAGAGAGAGDGHGSHAATGDLPSDTVSDLDADVGVRVRVDALINLMASIWQPVPLFAVAAADPAGPVWPDASHWAQADAAATKSSRLHALRAAMAACTRLPSWPAERDNPRPRGASPGVMPNGFRVAFAD